jgi:D-lactate dehydrogenase
MGLDNIRHDERVASDKDYVARIRDVDADTPARFNADPRRLRDASGSAGKLAIFALRLDTFPDEGPSQVFYVGANDPQVLTAIRRHILSDFENLPVAAEYLHREAFDITRRYGKDTFVMIDKLGTGWMPRFFALKSQIDATLIRLPLVPTDLLDKLLQAASRLWPEVLPQRLLVFWDRFEHHLMLKMAGEGVKEAHAFLKGFLGKADVNASANWFACSVEEGNEAFLHRFAAACRKNRLRVSCKSRQRNAAKVDRDSSKGATRRSDLYRR